MAYLARQEKNKPVLIGQISDQEMIPKKFLEAILLDLKKLGFVNSKQGKGGGYYLAKEPEVISLAALIRVLEEYIALLPCVSINYYEKCDDCPNEGVCQLNRVMAELRDSTLEILEKKTLNDLK